EKHKQLFTFNDTTVAYPKDKTIVDLFEEQVAKTPDNIAIVFEDTELTYRELNERSNQLAHYLMDNYSIQPDDLIGIQLERSEWMIVAILGVLKSGGAYVPIDPEYPSSRKEYIVKDSAIALLITEAGFIYDIDYYEGDVFAIDVEFDSENYSSETVSKRDASDHLAYVIYTSGSTGNPKGVMVEHQAIVNTILSQITDFNVNSGSRALQFASFSFDASISETFIILLSGARLFIATELHRKDPDLLVSFIRSNAIDIATLSPSILNRIEISELTGLKTLITAGESAQYEKAIDYLKYGTYYNAYGPTEASICGTIFKLDYREKIVSDSIPIGKPIGNTQIYILNEKEELQAIGVVGEICIGGNGLARGYLNQEGLTREKFITNPIKAGERLYKTGDLGRWLPDGNIEFIGRKDDQVKIRGHRIELGEIEHALVKHEAVSQVVVLARENESAEKELVAYIVSNVEQNASDLRAYLKQSLPEYMLPSYFVQLEAIPLTTNGKIDKKSLPNPKGLRLMGCFEYVAPRNELEEDLVKIWEEVLQRDKIGILDDFYDLGLDSLKAMRLIALVHKKLNIDLKIIDILENTNIQNLGKKIILIKDILKLQQEGKTVTYKNKIEI
ncbi:non-ribosomal peptide synthetase, partial [Flavobacterium lipolyticum]